MYSIEFLNAILKWLRCLLVVNREHHVDEHGRQTRAINYTLEGIYCPTTFFFIPGFDYCGDIDFIIFSPFL